MLGELVVDILVASNLFALYSLINILKLQFQLFYLSLERFLLVNGIHPHCHDVHDFISHFGRLWFKLRHYDGTVICTSLPLRLTSLRFLLFKRLILPAILYANKLLESPLIGILSIWRLRNQSSVRLEIFACLSVKRLRTVLQVLLAFSRTKSFSILSRIIFRFDLKLHCIFEHGLESIE